MTAMTEEKASLFADVPVSKAVLTLAVPTVISQLITVVYNMADTFFIGQLGDPLQVAAATLAMPSFMFLTAFANLFGLGGSSLISRCLGLGDRAKAGHTAAFCIWTGIAAAFLYGIGILLLEPVLFPLLGAKAETWDYLRQYVFWTIGVGAVPTVMNAEFAHLIRAEGYSKTAGFGVALGGILNIHLCVQDGYCRRSHRDHAFQFDCHAVFYWLFTAYPGQHGHYAAPEVVFLGTADSSGGRDSGAAWLCDDDDVHHLQYGAQSYCCRIFQHSSGRDGHCKKIDLLAYAISQGMTQGTLPLIGYNFSSGNVRRMKQSIKTAFLYSLIVAVCGAVALYFFAAPIAEVFISDAQTVHYGQTFLKIICLACPTTAINFMVITVFQAIGKKVQPLFLSLLRKGSLDLLLMVLLNNIMGISGIAWATPFADWVAFVISLALIIPCVRKLDTKGERM